MAKLSKIQKLDKRWKRYHKYVDAVDQRVYGMYTDRAGYLHFTVSGFPAPQEFTRKYNGAKRQIRRNKR